MVSEDLGSSEVWVDLQRRQLPPEIHPLTKADGFLNCPIQPLLTSPTVISSHTTIRRPAHKKYPLCLSPHGLHGLRRQAYNLGSQLAGSLGLGLHQLSLFLGSRAKSPSPQCRQTTPKEKALTYLYIPAFVELHEGSIKNQKPTDFQGLEYFQDSVLLRSNCFFSPPLFFFLSLFSVIRGSSFASEHLLVFRYYPHHRNSSTEGLKCMTCIFVCGCVAISSQKTRRLIIRVFSLIKLVC